MNQPIVSLLKRNRMFTFNVVMRDRWLRQEAALINGGSSVIDIGAGSAPYRFLFSHCKYVTQDFAQLAGEQLRHGSYARIDLVSDATNIPVKTASFDVAICTEVLEHVPEPERVISEISRILKPGGTLLLTAPLGSGIHQEPYHFYGGFTPFWYQRFLRKEGFNNIQITPNQGFFSHYAQESIRFLYKTRLFGSCLPPWLSLVFLPLWLILLPILGLVFPTLAIFLDKFDVEKHFTVGYHVKAVRLK